jgi:hypothetical protein
MFAEPSKVRWTLGLSWRAWKLTFKARSWLFLVLKKNFQPPLMRGLASSRSVWENVMAPKIPYYVVIKGNGYFRPKASMRALGFERVRCGKDGPTAWAIADVWARGWEQAKRGEFVPQRQQMASLKAYPPGSIGEAFHRFRRTAEWAKKAPRTREEWERGWAHLEPLLADVAPGTISLEDMSEVRTAIEARVSWREAHRVIKIWRALWKVAAAMGYCDRERDPSLGIRNSAPPPRQALWREGEIVRLVKAAWRAGYRGLAAVMGRRPGTPNFRQ